MAVFVVWESIGAWRFVKFLGIAVILFGTLIFVLEQGPVIVLLHLRSESTTGSVVTIDGTKHGLTTIRYRVHGIEYQRTFGAFGRSVGDKVSVFYSPDDPMRAITEDPSTGLWRVVSSSVLGSIWLVGGWTVLTMLRNPKWRPWRSKLPT
jgi:hypothetical protein